MDVSLRFQRAQEEGAVSCFSGFVCHIYSAPATKLRGQKWTDVSFGYQRSQEEGVMISLQGFVRARVQSP